MISANVTNAGYQALNSFGEVELTKAQLKAQRAAEKLQAADVRAEQKSIRKGESTEEVVELSPSRESTLRKPYWAYVLKAQSPEETTGVWEQKTNWDEAILRRFAEYVLEKTAQETLIESLKARPSVSVLFSSMDRSEDITPYGPVQIEYPDKGLTTDPKV